MKVLWIGNIILPKIAEKEKQKEVYVNGWLVQLSEKISELREIDLIYLFHNDKIMEGTTENYKYYSIQSIGMKKHINEKSDQLNEILKKEKPDIIHIWGTEYTHSLALITACKELGLLSKVVVSIQGLIYFCAKHYPAHLPERVTRQYTLKNLVQGTIKSVQKRWIRNSENEIKVLKLTSHVIGRTEWDKACVKSINPSVNYHFNNEMLRQEFYQGKWDIDCCEKHSIFFSQAGYPLKGLHFTLEALIEILKDYPDTKLYVAGKNHYEIPIYKRNSYEKYIIKIIRNNNLFNNVIFTGILDAGKMKEKYLQANVFVSSSSIENSPNSVCEAMILGVPTVASRVGGVHSLINHGEDGFMYPVDETYMLAYYIKQIFDNRKLSLKLSENARKVSLERHNKEQIVHDLVGIYKQIRSENE